MSLTEAEIRWDRIAMHVCEHSLEPGCFCAYCSDETRDVLPLEGELVHRVYNHWRGMWWADVDPFAKDAKFCPEDPRTACHDCAGRWWCDPDFWIPLALGQIEDDGTERTRVLVFPAGGAKDGQGHPEPVVEYR